MAQSLKTNITAILILSTLLCANHAVAKGCYEPSPNLSDAKNEYYNLDQTTILSTDKKQQVNNLFRSMGGKWKGKATYTECRGPDSAPRTEIRHAILTLNAKQTSTTSLTIHAKKHYKQERIKKLENLALLGASPVFEFEFIDDSHLIFSERLRKMNIGSGKIKIPKGTASSNTETIINKTSGDTNAVKDSVYQVKNVKKNRTSRITETIYDIDLNANSLTIKRAYYTNGVYTGEEQWHLRRQ
ncbi:MAG: hypothetical protein COB34_04065 [Methylophilaceae bacterium]|nr:MAG: hypothetical protein COB34_04065 [Methylophilaceae bacterium]